MGLTRRKITTVYKDLQRELNRLEKFDSENQRNFLSGKLSKQQLHLLTETIFFAAYRSYENFIRDIFLLYCMEKKPKTGARVKSYLRPKSFSHAECLIQSSMPFLDWASPDTVIDRAEVYLEEGYPVKRPYTMNLSPLRTFRRIRNHIAHNSTSSLEEFKKVLKDHYGTLPMNIPKPGEFLLVRGKSGANYQLLIFLDLIRTLSHHLT